jgi:hypothetical protein
MESPGNLEKSRNLAGRFAAVTARTDARLHAGPKHAITKY